MQATIKLFTDGSVNPKLKIGYGAYLLLRDENASLESLASQVCVMRFVETSSTKLELQTLLWALREIPLADHKILVYTDSQNTVGLMGRRAGFEDNDYCTKSGKRINHHELYKEFYRMTDSIECEFIKIKGHKKSHQKDALDAMFTLVDRASRNALRDDEEHTI